MTPRHLLVALLLSACSDPIGRERVDLDTTGYVYRQQLDGAYGVTWRPSCDYAPLVLDPRWDAEQREAIRGAARQWEDALGVDLGDLPAASEPCVPAVTESCIAVGDPSIPSPISHTPSIAIYPSRVATSDVLDVAAVALHEMGHYVGIGGHTELWGVMRARPPISDELTQVDVDLWSSYCAE